jgi:BRCT domain type II-containing protein
VLPRLTKKTDLLVVADASTPTTNLQKAKEYGIAMLDEPAFLAAIGIPDEAISRPSTRWASSVRGRR